MEQVSKPGKARKKKFSTSDMSMASMLGYMFILPALLTLIALVLYPLLYGVYISFFNTDLADKWDFIGFKNYIGLFKNADFVKQIGVTLQFTISVVAMHFILGTILAMALNKPRKGIKIFRTILVLPWLFPEVVVALLFKWIMNPMYGIFNYGLMKVGLIHDNIAWLSDAKYAMLSVIIVSVWKGYPLVMINVLAGLQSISADLYEASTIDGATRFQTFRYITLPSLRPVLLTTLVLDTVWWFKHYTIVALMTQGGPGSTTTIISIDIFKQAFDFFNFGTAAAMSVLVFAICYIITVLYRRFLDNED
jgi:multiple sugar transport system permease protein